MLEFHKFRIYWDVFKQLTTIPPSQIAAQLYSPCKDSVQNSILNTNADFFTFSELNMIQIIETIVTKHSNPAECRLNFATLTKSGGESMQNSIVQLKSVAKVCEYSCPSCYVDLQSIHVKDQFIQGSHNETLQTDILAKAKYLKSLEDIIKHFEVLESALRDQAQLHQQSDSASRISAYKKSRSNVSKPCAGYGTTNHTNS